MPGDPNEDPKRTWPEAMMLLNGVRAGVIQGPKVIAPEGESDGNRADPEKIGTCDASRRESAMVVSLRECVQRVSDPGNLEASVDEVFRMMLGIECQRQSGATAAGKESVTAVVGFGGLLSGACVFRSSAGTA